MAAVIIRKKDVERLGHTLLKDLYEFFSNEYILTNFEEMKIEQKNFNIILFYMILDLVTLLKHKKKTILLKIILI